MLQKNSLSHILLTDSSAVALKQVFTSYSMFKNHELKPLASHKGLPVLTNSPVYYWPSVVLFFVFSLYVSVRITDPKKIIKIVTSVFNAQMAKQLIREDYKLYKRVSILLSMCFVLVFSFLLYKINNHFDFILKETSSLVKYLFFMAVIIVMYSVKLLTNSLFAFITKTTETDSEYLFNVFLFAQVIGLVLLPLVACMQFSPFPIEWFLYPSLALCLLFFALRSVRGFAIAGLEQNSGFLYIILYFCALELLPLLVLVKFLINHF